MVESTTKHEDLPQGNQDESKGTHAQEPQEESKVTDEINCPGSKETETSEQEGPSASEGRLVPTGGGAMEQYRQRAESRLSVIEVSKNEVMNMAKGLKGYMIPGENPVALYENAV